MTGPAPQIRRPQRRGTELALLLGALLVAAAAELAVRQGVSDTLPAAIARLDWGGFVEDVLGLAALYLTAHLGIRRFAPYADPVILPAACALNGIGLAVIRRIDLASQAHARQAGTKLPPSYADLQVIWVALGIVLFLVVLGAIRDHRVLARYGYTAAAAGLFLLLLPAVPGVGSQINGARLWLRLGPLTFQPSEFAKIALMVFFASYLEAKRDVLSRVTSRSILGLELPRARDLGPILLAFAAALLVLIGENDVGTPVLFFVIFLVMLYVATERASWLLVGIGLFALGGLIGDQLIHHVQTRVAVWLHPFADPTGRGYQLVQSLFGFATGGLFGTGLGRGSPQVVPFARTDFIAAAIGEELGLAGLTAVLVLFLLLVSRGLRAAVTVRDSFGKLLAGGLAFSIALQVFIVVGGVSGLIPLTGMTLPLLSYGGSSLLGQFVLLALILRISDAARRPGPQVAAPQPGRQVPMPGDPVVAP